MFLKITIYTEKIINPMRIILIAIGKSEDSGRYSLLTELFEKGVVHPKNKC